MLQHPNGMTIFVIYYMYLTLLTSTTSHPIVYLPLSLAYKQGLKTNVIIISDLSNTISLTILL